MMQAPLAVSFHHWPWSMDVEEESVPAMGDGVVLPFFGSPVLSVMSGAQVLLAVRHEKFIPLGPPFEGKTEVYEVPHGILSHAGQNQAKMMIIANGERWNPTIEAEGAQRRTLEDGKTESDLALMILRWSQFFDDLLEGKIDDLLDGKINIQKQTGGIPWNHVLKFLKKQIDELQQPRLSLIVRIAKAMRTSLPATVTGMRRILLRERNMQRISRICETDVRCLQWYVRQPGGSMAEKGGSRQELLAVVRRESFDVLENRVLKDFVHRCNVESLRYITNTVKDNPQFKESKRAQDVRRFREICVDAAKHTHFKNVPRAGGGIRPNYVLQNDLRYRKVWTWYCRLLRQEEEQDRFWDWQARTWADIVRLIVNLAVVYLENEDPPLNGIHIRKVSGASLHVTREQILGSRTRGGSEPGPFVIEKISKGTTRPAAILEVVHPDEAHEHILAQSLGRTGGHLYLVIRPLNDFLNKNHVLIVWGINTAGTARKISWDNISKSAENALNFHRNILAGARIPNLPILHGLIAANDPNDLNTEQADVVCEVSNAPVVITPSDPPRWYDTVEFFAYLLQNWLDKLV